MVIEGVVAYVNDVRQVEGTDFRIRTKASPLKRGNGKYVEFLTDLRKDDKVIFDCL